MSARSNPVWIRPEGSARARKMESQYDLAYDNPYALAGFSWKLGLKETAAVVAVGVGFAWIANKAENTQTEHHQAAMLAGGTALYVLGVVLGANRPADGWIQG